jgi:hypothetical protein
MPRITGDYNFCYTKSLPKTNHLERKSSDGRRQEIYLADPGQTNSEKEYELFSGGYLWNKKPGRSLYKTFQEKLNRQWLSKIGLRLGFVF